MNYELAKQIRDAGFPFNWVETILDSMPPINSFLDYPTLSKLIESCGDEMNTLIKSDGKWSAYDNSFIGNSPAGVGLTPEEAVANLWLALNKK